jgi:ABC-type multidrug transport system fused ATPase/permease subunit
MEAAGIGLVFPFILALVDPQSLSRFEIVRLIGDQIGAGPHALAIGLGLAVGFLFITKNLLTALLLRWQFKTLFNAEAAAGIRLYERYLQTPWSKIAIRNSSEMIRNATTSLSVSFHSVIIPTMTLAVEAVIVLLVTVVLFVANAAVALASIGFALLAGAVYYSVVRNRLTSIGLTYQQAVFSLLNQVKEGIGAGREIRVLGRTNELIRQMTLARETYARAVSRRSFLLLLPRYYLETVLVIAILATIAALVGTQGANAMPVLALFSVAALRLLTSISRMLAAAQQIRIGLPALASVYEDLMTPVELEADATNPETPCISTHSESKTSAGSIVLTNVSFRYHERWALRNVNLSIPRGESLGIVGASGSGKSTLVDVILGLIIPQEGQVTIDGRDMIEVAGQWRKRIGYVPQSIYLTDDTLKRNIALGIADVDIDNDALNRVLRQANLSSFVASLSKGVDTPVGELGTFLSGGQRQRIGIARALYHNPDVLILDEATSALDSETERSVLDAVYTLANDKTIIIVAHRISTVSRCARLIVLNEGRIVETGTLQELTAPGSQFARGFELFRANAGEGVSS